jgi:hypothetical protein
LNAGDVVEALVGISIATGTIYATNVNYVAPYTNAVTQTVETKLAQTISVKDFGAKGDGVTNDTAALRAALSASSNIYFPPGIYIVDGTDTGTLLTITNSNVTIYGSGYSTTRIQAKSGVNGFNWISGDGSSHANIVIKDIWFYGNNSSRGTGEDYILTFNNMQNILVEDCRFEAALSHNTNSKAVFVTTGSLDVMIRNNSFASNGGEDINFYGSNGSVYRCSAIGNEHYQPQGPCIEIEGRNGTTITGYQVYDVNIIGNTIRSDAAYASAGNQGILCIGGFNVNIEGNIIDRRGTDGMAIIGSTNVNIDGNIVRDMGAVGYNGIHVTQDVFGANGIAVNINISNNIIDSCNNCGISIFGGETILSTVENFVVTNNICTNLTTGINATGVTNYSSSNNSFRSCSSTNYSITALSGAIAIMDAGNNSGFANYPSVMSQKNINFTSSGTLTLDVSTGINTFNIDLGANVTAVNITGNPVQGQKLCLLFLQTGSTATVTTTSSNWTTNGVADFSFPSLTVPALPGASINGRWGYIEFVYGLNTVTPNKWVMTTSQLNCG